MNTRELWREVVGQLAKLQTAHSDMEPAFLQEELGNEFAAIVQAFTILGAKRMEELGYSRSKIEAAMTRTEENVLLTAPKMQEAVYAQYKTGDLVACSEINNFLHRLIVNNGIPFEGRRVDRKVVKLFSRSRTTQNASAVKRHFCSEKDVRVLRASDRLCKGDLYKPLCASWS